MIRMAMACDCCGRTGTEKQLGLQLVETCREPGTVETWCHKCRTLLSRLYRLLQPEAAVA